MAKKRTHSQHVKSRAKVIRVMLPSKPAVKVTNNVDVFIPANGVLQPISTISVYTGQAVYWTIRNESGVTVAVTVNWFILKSDKKSKKIVDWFNKDGDGVRLGPGENGVLGGIVNHKAKVKDYFKYSILVEITGGPTVSNDPDLDVSPPPAVIRGRRPSAPPRTKKA